ncbi:MAG: threonine/serine exporter family protein [Eubacteriales bacterium]
MLIQIIGVAIAIGAFAILLETPRKYIIYTALTGAIGGGSFLILLECGVNETASYFLSAFLITVCSNILAKMLKSPVTVYLIAGILPTVPGAGVYQVAYNMMVGNQELSVYYLLETLKFAGAISLGIFLAETIFRVIMRELIYRKS